jgi:hypothetical protein
MLLADTLATSDDELPAVPADPARRREDVQHGRAAAHVLRPDERRHRVRSAAVLAFDAGQPPAKLAPVTLNPVTPVLDHPYAVRAGNSSRSPRPRRCSHDALRPTVGDREARREGLPDAGRTGRARVPVLHGAQPEPQTVVAVLDPDRIRAP